LFQLNLADNELTALPDLSCLNLLSLDLSGNKFTNLDPKLFDGMMGDIKLARNPWNCNECTPLIEWADKNEINVEDVACGDEKNKGLMWDDIKTQPEKKGAEPAKKA